MHNNNNNNNNNSNNNNSKLHSQPLQQVKRDSLDASLTKSGLEVVLGYSPIFSFYRRLGVASVDVSDCLTRTKPQKQNFVRKMSGHSVSPNRALNLIPSGLVVG